MTLISSDFDSLSALSINVLKTSGRISGFFFLFWTRRFGLIAPNDFVPEVLRLALRAVQADCQWAFVWNWRSNSFYPAA